MTRLEYFAQKVHDEWEEGKTDVLYSILGNDCRRCSLHTDQELTYERNGETEITYCKSLHYYEMNNSFNTKFSCEAGKKDYWSQEVDPEHPLEYKEDNNGAQ